MPDLTLTLIQPQPAWHRIEENLVYYAGLLAGLPKPAGVVVLPEMFTTGFTMDSAAVAEPMEGRTHNWLRTQAARLQAAVCGSIVIKEEGHYYNRFLWVTPDGTTVHYDKRHLFRMAAEHEHYTGGKQLATITWQGWRLRPLICYDLRFPVWARNSTSNGAFAYDLLLLVANWPASRISAWDALLPARAIENLAYCVGVNRVGEDGQGVVYNGHSGAYNPKGETLCLMQSTGTVATVTLSKKKLDAFRKQFPAHLDADSFRLTD